MDMESKEGMMQYCKKVCETNGWILNNDETTLNDLIEGLVDNKKRYGYQSCPCRLASGNRDLDRDLICPCEYAKPDIEQYRACYCNLYTRKDFKELDVIFVAVPERRPVEKERDVLDYINEQM